MEQKPIYDILAEARSLLGPNGERWIKGSFHSGNAHCAAGAILDVTRDQPTNNAFDVLVSVVEGSVLIWNDASERTFADVDAAFEQAMELVC